MSRWSASALSLELPDAHLGSINYRSGLGLFASLPKASRLILISEFTFLLGGKLLKFISVFVLVYSKIRCFIGAKAK